MCLDPHLNYGGGGGGGGASLNWFKPRPVRYFTDRPRRYFFCGSFMFFLSCVCHAFVSVCLFVPCGHLLGKG